MIYIPMLTDALLFYAVCTDSRPYIIVKLDQFTR